MFKNLRRKLFAIFLLFSVLCISILLLSNFYSRKKEKIDFVEHSLTSVYLSTLQDFRLINDFFNYDTKNDDYFRTGKSKYLISHNINIQNINKLIVELQKNNITKQFKIDTTLLSLNSQIIEYHTEIKIMETLIKSRGYKDYGCEGKMRENIHKIENFDFLNQTTILSIRRNEKDYIIRNETKYVDYLKFQVEKLFIQINSNSELLKQDKDSCTFFLKKYSTFFDSIVLLDSKIGIKNNSGQKLKLNILEDSIQTKFNSTLVRAYNTKISLYNKLYYDFLFFSTLLIIFSLIFSYYVSKIITKPITALSLKIHNFVNSGFESVDNNEIKTSDVEIQNLINNFLYLKKELLSLLNDFKQKVHQRTIEILTQKEKLELQKEEIETQNELLLSHNNIIKIQKQNLEETNRNMTSSMVYARQIQNTLIPTISEFQNYFPESFVLNKPKDIVSGDFYWFKRIKNKHHDVTLIAVADCTGHGVPGAMMSMLGITLINEIVYRTSIQSSSQVLDELRIEIKKSLQQTGKRSEQQDGMDITFCVINNETMELSFSGAYNPLWLFRPLKKEKSIINFFDQENISNIEYEFTEIKGDKQPIGIYPKESPFTESIIKLRSGDILYLFSDGYHSQLGGEFNKKMKSKNMKSFVEGIIEKPIIEQSELLEQKYSDWKGNFAQTDDILVLGFKIIY